ncbi:MAG: DUF4199 domain-containing protein [Sphingobacteriales bacterium]|nr:MAG: DUF4199 domain-containing protein [Sphingobacteriales bacterium]
MDNVTTEIDYSASSRRLGLVYGLLTGIAMVVFSLVLYFTHVSMDSWLNYMVLVIFVLGVVAFCIAYGRSQHQNVSFGMVFKAGFRMVAFTTLIMLAWAVLAIFVFPEMKEQSLEATRQLAIAQKMPHQLL